MILKRDDDAGRDDVENAIETQRETGRQSGSYGTRDEPGEDEEDYWRGKEDWYGATRRAILPGPEPFIARAQKGEEGDVSELFLQKDDGDPGGKGVVVKLAGVQLIPEMPKYDGGSEQVEGQSVSLRQLIYRSLSSNLNNLTFVD